jgi:adenosylcobinamide-GDP ribazoletransferase
MRHLIFALQFLTRLPTPALKNTAPDMLSKSKIWFPFVGLIIGCSLILTLSLGAKIDPWFGALLTLLCWVWITGGIHIDGLADLADALGAAHRDPVRLLAIMRDPHVGSFGVLATGLLLISKLILLMLLVREIPSPWMIALIPAWARYGAMVWSQTLPPLGPGLGEQFSQKSSGLPLWGLGLLCVSWLLAPALLFAPAALLIWWLFLKNRLRGMNGDCLGAGIEIIETMLLGAIIVFHKFYG